MSTQFIGALKAAATRIAEQRSAMRVVQVVCRVTPEGLQFACNIPAKSQAELEAGKWRTVTWDEMPDLTPADAIRIVDEVCAPSRALLAERREP